MDWFNIFGFSFIAVIMLPNILYALKIKNNVNRATHSKAVEIIEQIGRYGCIAFMIFNIPSTWFGWWSDNIFAIYLIVNGILAILYCALWVILWNKNNLFKSFALSIIPVIIFLFSGITSRSILLIISSLLFTPTHIYISIKNFK